MLFKIKLRNLGLSGSASACPINNMTAVMLAGPAISGMASGNTAISSLS